MVATVTAGPRAPSDPVRVRFRVEIRVVTITADDRDRLLDGPADCEGRIIPAHAVDELWRVRIGHLIEHFGVVGQRLETVRHEGRYVRHYQSAPAAQAEVPQVRGESGRRSMITS
jgi:hypothetical protein